MNGKLYIHWRFIPSCHFMFHNFSWGYKTSKTILMRFHPSQGPSKKTTPSPTSHIGICQVVKEVKTRVVPTSCGGLVLLLLSAGTFPTDHANSISPTLHLPQQIVVKNKKHILKREKETPFFWRLGISFALDHENPTPVKNQHRPRNWAYFAFPSDYHANSCDWRFSSLGRMPSWLLPS